MTEMDRVKIKALAESCLRKGRFEKALQCYRTLEKVDPNDLRVRQKIAELLIRVDRKGEAIAKYWELADEYLEKGFTVQVIAMMKIVLYLNPVESGAEQKLEQLIEARSEPKLMVKDTRYPQSHG